MPNSDNKVILQSRKKIFFFSFQYYLFLSEMTLNEKEIFIFIDTCAQYQIVKDIQKLLFYFPVGFAVQYLTTMGRGLALHMHRLINYLGCLVLYLQ